MSDEKFVLACLAAVSLLLLVVGIVSGTLIRHMVQIVPVLAAAGIVLRRPSIGASISIPVLVFWISMMVLIWLFLLGWSDIAYGTYSPAEVILTFAIASCATLGLSPSFRLGQPVAAWRRTYLAVLAAAVQSGFMILSFQAPFASR